MCSSGWIVRSELGPACELMGVEVKGMEGNRGEESKRMEKESRGKRLPMATKGFRRIRIVDKGNTTCLFFSAVLFTLQGGVCGRRRCREILGMDREHFERYRGKGSGFALEYLLRIG